MSEICLIVSVKPVNYEMMFADVQKILEIIRLHHFSFELESFYSIFILKI